MTKPTPATDVNSPMHLGAKPHLYRPDLWRSAKEIGISQFRQIFTWPLALRLDRAETGRRGQRKALERSIKALMQHKDWQLVSDRLDQDTPSDLKKDQAADKAEKDERAEKARTAEQAQTYSEFVYFHDFMQDTLFGKAQETPDAGEPVSIFSHKRIKRLKVGLRMEDKIVWTATADVVRVQLHLYRTGALILAVELMFEQRLEAGDATRLMRPMRLSDVQMITDRLRRVYAPYFEMNEEVWQPGLVPTYVTWQDQDGQDVISSGTIDDERPGLALEGLRKLDRTGRRNPPVHPHWAALLAPLRVAGDSDAKCDEPLWRHVVDERVPTMSFVSLRKEPGDSVRDTLRRVSRGDWIRLCYADSPGTSPLPYSAEFLKDFEQDTCYDRFMACDSLPDYFGLRYMFAGYHFSIVGSDEFFEKTIQHHFRRHYFQMAKAVHMELASLLATSSRVTDAVRDLREADPGEGARQRFSETLLDIQHDFMDFVHLFRFTGMSNQIQPTEMFRLWRRTLDLDAMFQDVGEELRSATGFLYAEDDRRQTDSAARLNMIALLGVVLGIGLAFLGAKVIFDPKDWAPPFGGLAWWFGPSGNLAALGFSLGAPSVVAMALLRILTPQRGSLYRTLMTVMWSIVGLSVLLVSLDFFLPVALDALKNGHAP